MARTLVDPIPLSAVSLKEAQRRLKQSRDAGDIVRPTNHPDYYFVSSKSRPGFSHATSLKACDCEAHAYRGLCRHRIAVSWYLHQQAKQQAQAQTA